MNTNNDGFFSDEEMGTLQNIALEELRELCDGLVEALSALRANPADPGARKQAVHLFHTIGGSAGLAGFRDISIIGVDMEGVLRKHGPDAPLNGEILDQLSAAHQSLDTLITLAAKTAR